MLSAGIRFGRRGAWAFFTVGVAALLFTAACGDRLDASSGPHRRDEISNAEPSGPGPAATAPALNLLDHKTFASTLPSDCTFKDIAAGTRHTCAVQTSGKMSCWGDAYSYVLGIGYDLQKGTDYQGNSLYLHPYPEVVRIDPNDGGGTFDSVARVVNVDVDGSRDGVCTLRNDGTVWCWGLGMTGYPRQMRDGLTTDDGKVPFSNVTSFFGGGGICGIRSSGELYCGAYADYSFPTERVEASTVSNFSNAASASSRPTRKCASKTDGTVWCWGSDSAAQKCTAGADPTGRYPEQVFTSSPSTFLTGIANVQTGKNFSCALRASGTVHCWGNDYSPYGALGDGTTAGTLTSVKCNAADVTDGTTTLSGVTALATGYNHSCALKNDGTVWCWGSNNHGQLGSGSFTNSAVAKKVVLGDGSALSSVVKISASLSNTCAVRADGTALCWGAGSAQQIGDGYGIDRTNPSQVKCVECTTDTDCDNGSPQSTFGHRCTSPNNLCGECLNDNDCMETNGAKPICNRSGGRAKCEACGGDFGSRLSNKCPVDTPICSPSGACNAACTQAGITYPSSCGTEAAGAEQTCVTTGTLTGHCAPCDGDFGGGTTRPCGAFRPLCTSGLCVACTKANASTCPNAQPACDTNSATCSSCQSDYGDPSAPSCPSLGSPSCADGLCGKCASNADCNGHASGSVCNTATGYCSVTCATDNDCNSAPLCSGNKCWCQGTSTKVCTPKAPNGVAISAAAPISGSCTAPNAQRACLSGVCDTATNLCGLPQGAVCGPPTANASCTSATCSPSDYKCGGLAGDTCRTTADCRVGLCANGKCAECGYDTDCKDTAKPICDVTAQTCRGCAAASVTSDCRTAKAAACVTSGSKAGQCAMCTAEDTQACFGATPVCDTTANTCIACNGDFGRGASAACPETAGLCNADGRCVSCTVDAQCTGKPEGPTCNVTTGKCGPTPPLVYRDASTDGPGQDGDGSADAGLSPNAGGGEDEGCSMGPRSSRSPVGSWILALCLGAAIAMRRRTASHSKR